MQFPMYATLAALLLPLALHAQAPGPTGIIKNGINWTIGENDVMPLVRSEKASYIFQVGIGKVTLNVDGADIKNISAPTTLLLTGKEISISSKFSAGRASNGTIQRVPQFALNDLIVNTQAGMASGEAYPAARFDTPRAFSITVEGPPRPDNRPSDCKDSQSSYVKIYLDGSPLLVPGSPNTEAKFTYETGYMGKAKAVDWAIVGPQMCQYTTVFRLLDE